jgi:hypothetical protein
MQQRKINTVPVWLAEVPPCILTGKMDGGSVSQLVRSVALFTSSSLDDYRCTELYASLAAGA